MRLPCDLYQRELEVQTPTFRLTLRNLSNLCMGEKHSEEGKTSVASNAGRICCNLAIMVWRRSENKSLTLLFSFFFKSILFVEISVRYLRKVQYTVVRYVTKK